MLKSKFKKIGNFVTNNEVSNYELDVIKFFGIPNNARWNKNSEVICNLY